MRAGSGATSKASNFRSRCLKFHNFVPADPASHHGGPESSRLQEQHGTKKITVASTSWLSAGRLTTYPSQSPQCILLPETGSDAFERPPISHYLQPHPVGGIVPASRAPSVLPQTPVSAPSPPLAGNLLTLLRPPPFAPTTHLTPEVTITPILGLDPDLRGSSDNIANGGASIGGDDDAADICLRKRKSEDVRRLLNLKISRKDVQKTQRDEQPLDLSLRRESPEETSGCDEDIQIVGFEVGFHHLRWRLVVR
ncbi:hypothetical protein BIW11_03526 [Tropilaelaps mercedesae]|uniref:Uncharacterized protein n=1 Tax=Tropilaelaps mercedesae TaxID=418985 RepID=A0A1V9XJT8_9ACAR|nr:hypothetical protein BIW11_03526 [Tropilaelaps mercedesae]